MYLVDKQQGLLAGIASLAGTVKHLAKIGHAVKDSGDRLELHASLRRQKTGNGRLACPGWPPEDDRGQVTAIQHPAKPSLRPEKGILPDHLGQRFWAQQFGKRRVGVHLSFSLLARLGRGVEVKLVHGAIFARSRGMRQRKSG